MKELLDCQTGLLDESFQGAGLEGFVLGNNHGAVFSAQDAMRTSLAELNEAESPQDANRLGS